MSTTVNAKKQAFEQGMLHYFNQILLQKGIITEQEYRAMKQKIQARDQALLRSVR